MKRIEVVAAVIERDELILATQRGYGDFAGGWEFPGGKVEAGEEHSEALAREIKEELEVDINVGDFITTVEYEYPKFHITMHCYKCTILQGELNFLEHSGHKWLSLDNLMEVDWLPADLPVVEKLISNNL